MSEERMTTTLPQTEAEVVALQREVLEAKIKNGGNWFYWIVALSGINTVLIVAGLNWHFLIGLGITQLLAFSVPTAIISYIFAGSLFATFGYFATRRYTWAFIAGVTLYAIDGLLFLAVQDWFSIAFHVVAVVGLSRGLTASLEHGRLSTETNQ